MGVKQTDTQPLIVQTYCPTCDRPGITGGDCWICRAWVREIVDRTYSIKALVLGAKLLAERGGRI